MKRGVILSKLTLMWQYLQEATEPPTEVARMIGTDVDTWHIAGAGRNRPWRAAVVNISRKYDLQWINPKSVEAAEPRRTGACQEVCVCQQMLAVSSSLE